VPSYPLTGASMGRICAPPAQSAPGVQYLISTDTPAAGIAGPATIPASATIPTPPAPLLETLTDDFATADTAKWNFQGGSSVVGGRLQLVPTGAYDADAVSVARYSLLGSTLTVEIAGAANFGGGSEELYLSAITSDRSQSTIFITGDVIGYRETAATGGTNQDTLIPWDPVAHRWVRLDHTDPANVLWQTSPDGVSWITQATKAPNRAYDYVSVELYCGFWGTEPDPGVWLLDNLNNPPPPGATITADTVPATTAVFGTVTTTALVTLGVIAPGIATIAVPGVSGSVTVTPAALAPPRR
jgi:hypothetical protein